MDENEPGNVGKAGKAGDGIYKGPPFAGDRPLNQVTFAVVDVETTGLSPGDGHRVCEVACLRVCGGQELGRFASLVDPLRPLDEGAARVNGITPEMLAGAPQFGDVAPALLALMQDAVLVAHNAPFDVGFLHAELDRAGYERPYLPVVDTLALARRVYTFRRNGLQDLAEYLSLEVGAAHRAMGDVLTTWQLLTCLMDTIGWMRGIHTLGGLMAIQRR